VNSSTPLPALYCKIYYTDEDWPQNNWGIIYPSPQLVCLEPYVDDLPWSLTRKAVDGNAISEG